MSRASVETAGRPGVCSEPLRLLQRRGVNGNLQLVLLFLLCSEVEADINQIE